MRQTIIIAVPMKEHLDQSVYRSEDKSLPTSDKPVFYPINSYLDHALKDGDRLKVLLLLRQGTHCHSEKNAELYREELAGVIGERDVSVEYAAINTDFAQSRAIHTQLMGTLVDHLEDGAHILVDTTYGPKDQPIIIFAALGFAEKFLRCKAGHIFYGQAEFVNGHVTDTRLCDLSPLYGLSSVTGLIHCDQPGKARNMLKMLLSS